METEENDFLLLHNLNTFYEGFLSHHNMQYNGTKTKEANLFNNINSDSLTYFHFSR